MLNVMQLKTKIGIVFVGTYGSFLYGTPLRMTVLGSALSRIDLLSVIKH